MFCLGEQGFTMTKGLADSDRAYTERNVGEKTKQNFVSHKNTAFDKNHTDYWVASLKMIKNGLKN